MEVSVEEDELLEDTALDDSDGADSEVRGAAEAAFFAGYQEGERPPESVVQSECHFFRRQRSPCLREMTGHEATETTNENATACVLLAEKLVTGVVTACVQNTKSHDTLERRRTGKMATRMYPVCWVGTSTCRWEMDAGNIVEFNHQRRHNYGV